MVLSGLLCVSVCLCERERRMIEGERDGTI